MEGLLGAGKGDVSACNKVETWRLVYILKTKQENPQTTLDTFKLYVTCVSRVRPLPLNLHLTCALCYRLVVR